MGLKSCSYAFLSDSLFYFRVTILVTQCNNAFTANKKINEGFSSEIVFMSLLVISTENHSSEKKD